MNMLAIDRSTAIQSVAVLTQEVIHARVLAEEDVRSAGWAVKVRDFLASLGLGVEDLDRIAVGTGPGSFAGVRAALAFAQGVKIGIGAKRGPDACKVVGMPSTLALARASGKTAVIGDARRGQYWIVLYDDVATTRDFTLVGQDAVFASVPEDCIVVTPDADRIGGTLAKLFGERYAGGATPLAGRLAEIARAHPEVCVENPLPTYLAPAVRPPA